MDFQEYLEEFYARYNVELIRAPEGFFYLRSVPPLLSRAFRLVGTGYDGQGKSSVISISARERLANEGFSPQQELYDELLTPPMKQNC